MNPLYRSEQLFNIMSDMDDVTKHLFSQSHLFLVGNIKKNQNMHFCVANAISSNSVPHFNT